MIKELREKTGVTQKDFAEYFNIPVRTLQDWEQNRRKPPSYVIELIKYKIKKERLEVAGKGKDIYTIKEVVYVHDEDNIEVIGEFSGNIGLTVDQALDLIEVDMDEYAEDQGWDGYDWNSLEIRIKK